MQKIWTNDDVANAIAQYSYRGAALEEIEKLTKEELWEYISDLTEDQYEEDALFPDEEADKSTLVRFLFSIVCGWGWSGCDQFTGELRVKRGAHSRCHCDDCGKYMEAGTEGPDGYYCCADCFAADPDNQCQICGTRPQDYYPFDLTCDCEQVEDKDW